MRLGMRLVAAVLTLCAAAPLHAAAQGPDNDPATITIPYRPEIGQRSIMRIIDEEIRFEDGGSYLKKHINIPIDTEVIGRHADGFVVRWTYGRPETSARAAVAQNPVVVAISDMVDGMQIELEVDEIGAPQRTRNLDEVRGHMAGHFEAMLRKFPPDWRRRGIEETTVVFLEKTLEALLDGARTMSMTEAMDAHVTKYPLPHLVRLESHRLGETIEKHIEAQTVLGGPTFPAIVSKRVLDFDPKTGRARIEWTQRFDPETAKDAVAAVLPRMAREFGMEIPKENMQKLSDLRIINWIQRWTYDCNVRTGRVASAVAEETVETSEGKLVSRKSVTITPVP